MKLIICERNQHENHENNDERPIVSLLPRRHQKTTEFKKKKKNSPLQHVVGESLFTLSGHLPSQPHFTPTFERVAQDAPYRPVHARNTYQIPQIQEGGDSNEQLVRDG